MRCPRCHAENREGRRFCGECGLSFASPCPSCGFLNEGNEKFCGGCGRSLTSAPAPPEPRFNSPQSYSPHPHRFDAESGEAHYRQALALAEPRGMRPLVAHCHLGLGKLYRRAGMPDEARDHLTTARAMYGEMQMSYWLEQTGEVAIAPAGGG